MGKVSHTKEEIKNEIAELEADQHPNFFRDEPRGRIRMSNLLKELNVIEKSKTKTHY
jgi:hypothetical protein